MRQRAAGDENGLAAESGMAVHTGNFRAGKIVLPGHRDSSSVRLPDYAMNTEARYYTAAAGQTYGPYPASAFPKMLANGNVDYATPVCAEGGSEWTTLGAIAPYMGLPPAPAPPPPRPAAHAGHGSHTADGRRVVVVKPRRGEPQALKATRLGSLLVALGLFFLPWLEVQCSGKGMVYQTGYHTIMRDGEMTGEMKEMGEAFGDEMGGGANLKMKDKDMKDDPNAPDRAWLVAAAAAVIILAFGVGFVAPAMLTGGLAVVAALLLVAQMALKFPVEKKLMEQFDEKKNEAAKVTEVAGSDPGKQLEAQVEAQMKQAMMVKMMFKVAYQPAFWAELGVLGLCFALCMVAARKE